MEEDPVQRRRRLNRERTRRWRTRHSKEYLDKLRIEEDNKSTNCSLRETPEQIRTRRAADILYRAIRLQQTQARIKASKQQHIESDEGFNSNDTISSVKVEIIEDTDEQINIIRTDDSIEIETHDIKNILIDENHHGFISMQPNYLYESESDIKIEYDL